MTEVKARLIMNLTRRQVVCFGTAAAIGAPLFLGLRGTIGNTGAMVLMIAAVIPAFFFAIYSKDGVIPAEKFLLLVLRQMFFYPKIRIYRTQNLYEFIENNTKEEYFGKTTAKSEGNAIKNKSSPKGKARRA